MKNQAEVRYTKFHDDRDNLPVATERRLLLASEQSMFR